MEGILTSLANVFSPMTLLIMLFGSIWGIVFAAIPGLTISTAVALVIPMTYSMNPTQAIALMIAVYCGGMSGGLISAILLRVPGTSSAVATCLDGFPLAQKGFAGKAMGIGMFASFFGGLFSSIALLFIAPQLAKVAIQFGPYEYFGIALFSIGLVSVLSEGNVIKGIISALIGLMFSFTGSSPIDGTYRLTFGLDALNSGYQLLCIMIGLFALSELFSASKDFDKRDSVDKFESKGKMLPSFKDIKRNIKTYINSSVIGTIIGILPGLGGGPASLLSYAQAKKASKNPEEFGHGAEEGIIAPEAANNAVTGGALIPMLTLGVPGDAVTALMLSGFIIHGISVGPLLFKEQPILIRSILISVFIANIIVFAVGAGGIKFFAKVLKTPKFYLYPFIMVFCVIGVLSINNRMFDVWAMLVFGFIGFILEKNKFPLAPLILAFILGSMLEENFRRTIMYYGNIQSALTSFSLGTLFIAITFIIPIVKFISKKIKQRKAV